MSANNDGKWHQVDVPVPDGLNAAQVQTFVTNLANQLSSPPATRVVTAAQYQTLPNAQIIAGTDPTKAQAAAANTAGLAAGIAPLYMFHTK